MVNVCVFWLYKQNGIYKKEYIQKPESAFILRASFFNFESEKKVKQESTAKYYLNTLAKAKIIIIFSDYFIFI
jgi:hypothetical protein